MVSIVIPFFIFVHVVTLNINMQTPNKFNNHVYYYVCDFLYREYEKSDYQSFNNMCETIRTKMNSEVSLTRQETKIINNTMNDIYRVFNFSDDEITDYLYKFITNKMWSKFDSIVVTLRSHFGPSIY